MRDPHRWSTCVLFAFICSIADAQLPSSVDIKAVPYAHGPGTTVMLRANGASYSGVVGSVTFTVRWPASSSATMHPPFAQCQSGLPFTAGPMVVNGGYKYQRVTSTSSYSLSYNSCLLQSGEWFTVCRIGFNLNGECIELGVVNDAYTASNNGDFAVTIQGQNKTGIIDSGVGVTCFPSSVDINLTPSQTPNALDVYARCNGQSFMGVVSSFDFTIRWLAGSSASLGSDADVCADGVNAAPQATITAGGYKYKTYNSFGVTLLDDVGCFWPADQWFKITTINVVDPGQCTTFSLMNDAWTVANYREYYVSLAAIGRTGIIVPNAVTICAVDCQNVTSGPAQPGIACDDNDACTLNDTWSPSCLCVGILSDQDGDGVCDLNDNCPSVFGQVGSACDDGNANTTNDVLTATCICAGTEDCELQAKAFMEGPYIPGDARMADNLRDAGLLPSAEPYSALGYTFIGGGGGPAGASVLADDDANSAKVDWVIVELRSVANPATIVTSRAALISRDGTVTDETGQPDLLLKATPGSYYVALRHRNHLGVMTAIPVAFTAGTASVVDFSQSTTAVYGTNARKNSGGTEVLWAGDVTFNGEVKYTGSGNDRDPILTTVGSTTPNNTVPATYSTRDVNMDGTVKYTGSANDRDPILVNVGSTTPNNVRVQQLP